MSEIRAVQNTFQKYSESIFTPSSIGLTIYKQNFGISKKFVDSKNVISLFLQVLVILIKKPSPLWSLKRWSSIAKQFTENFYGNFILFLDLEYIVAITIVPTCSGRPCISPCMSCTLFPAISAISTKICDTLYYIL